jgi:hypothetical protein
MSEGDPILLWGKPGKIRYVGRASNQHVEPGKVLCLWVTLDGDESKNLPPACVAPDCKDLEFING